MACISIQQLLNESISSDLSLLIFTILGVSEKVVERAAQLLVSMENNKNADRLVSESISAQDQQYQV